MEHVLEDELFTVPQYERVAKLREEVPSWLEKLQPNQTLIIGLLPMLANWKEVRPIIIGPHMQHEFMEWVEENKELITGPHFMLPALQGFFHLVCISMDYNPQAHGIPETASASLQATLQRFGEYLNE